MNDASPRLTERGRQRRRAMLDAATQAFLEHGFEGTTLDMVIERAGGSRGTLYSSFGGKEGLFAAVIIAHMIEEIFDDSADQPRPAATLSATLEHFGRRFLTSLLDPRCQSLYRLVVAESPRFPAIGKSFYEQGPQQSYLLLSERLAAVAPHMDEETLYAVACQFLEMLKADLFLKALSVADFQPTMALLETRLKLSVDIIACYLEHLSQRPAQG
ncbi:efflux system transcriptional repressor NalC [Pseudomonas aeruginosa]|uniref:efflux system transcriptional repressor NalC n=1 Tax=Pseudomonas aeruginosa TaxID=287 RepID=UPI0023417A9B|nr:efflux system transcriptional repressor NalC [Pseudomonas aeruginosa]MDC3813915.1 efflux system transcriptional repressor NalC [Pseudomonas aeruginosa]